MCHEFAWVGRACRRLCRRVSRGKSRAGEIASLALNRHCRTIARTEHVSVFGAFSIPSLFPMQMKTTDLPRKKSIVYIDKSIEIFMLRRTPTRGCPAKKVESVACNSIFSLTLVYVARCS